MNERRTIDLGPLPELIGYVLRRAQLAVFQDFFAAFAPFDIRPAQFSVLTIIERNPGLTQTHVAAALGIKRTNFVGLLEASWSCYRAEGPCGKCTPCLARAAAGIPSPSGRA